MCLSFGTLIWRWVHVYVTALWHNQTTVRWDLVLVCIFFPFYLADNLHPQPSKRLSDIVPNHAMCCSLRLEWNCLWSYIVLVDSYKFHRGRFEPWIHECSTISTPCQFLIGFRLIHSNLACCCIVYGIIYKIKACDMQGILIIIHEVQQFHKQIYHLFILCNPLTSPEQKTMIIIRCNYLSFLVQSVVKLLKIISIFVLVPFISCALHEFIHVSMPRNKSQNDLVDEDIITF